MKRCITLALGLTFLIGCGATATSQAVINESTVTEAAETQSTNELIDSALYLKSWMHGTKDCAQDNNAGLEVFSQDASTHILRQNKCHTFEAPFMYLLIGQEHALLFDTGAIEDPAISPVYEKVKELIEAAGKQQDFPLLVIHSHGHSDHRTGDEQFIDTGAIVVSTKKEQVMKHFQLQNWPEENAMIALGDRTITLIPTPGHHDDAVSLYDSKTQYLFTGDTFYPGQIFVKEWEDFKQSINKLSLFAEKNYIKGILGGHIEMKSAAGEMYAIGTTYQPEEAPLPLATAHLLQLNKAMQNQSKPEELKFNRFIVTPMSGIQKTLSSVFSWIVD